MTTTSQQTRPESQPPGEKAVADYLRDNPDFFQNNTSLLATLQIPHGCGSAVSLVEHQVRVLRDQNRQLKRKLMDLVQTDAPTVPPTIRRWPPPAPRTSSPRRGATSTRRRSWSGSLAVEPGRLCTIDLVAQRFEPVLAAQNEAGGRENG